VKEMLKGGGGGRFMRNFLIFGKGIPAVVL
jgi:hypothetical protein